MKAPTQLRNIDETVVLPRAVRDAAARSAELIAEAYPASPENAADPAAAPNPDLTFSAPTPETPAPTPQVEETPNWEHMYKSLKGRHDRAERQISELAQRLDEVQRSPAPASAPPPAPTAPASRLITPQEESEYGTEFLQVVGKRARDEFGTDIEGLKATVAQLQGKLDGVAQVTTMSAKDKMFATLDERLPTWKAVNTDPKFLSWLELPDAFSGVTRYTLLTQAYERNETSRLLAFFNGFLSEEAATAPQPTRTEVTPGVTPGGKVPLEQLAAPGRAKTAAATDSAPAEKPVITTAQISKFYADVAAGKYRDDPDAKNATERAIFDAQKDGRIR